MRTCDVRGDCQFLAGNGVFSVDERNDLALIGNGEAGGGQLAAVIDLFGVLCGNGDSIA